MKNNKDRIQGAPGRGPIEDRLRHLSQPAAPPQLRAKILATIPAFAPAARPARRIGWRWSLAGLSAVAAGLLLTLIVLHWSSRDGRLRQFASLSDTSPRHILMPTAVNLEKETRPCAILPPSPYPFLLRH